MRSCRPTNRKPTLDFPISLKTKFCSICNRLVVISMSNKPEPPNLTPNYYAFGRQHDMALIHLSLLICAGLPIMFLNLDCDRYHLDISSPPVNCRQPVRRYRRQSLEQSAG